MLVDFNEETCEMKVSDDFQYFDYGLELYAPQSTLDKEGRRIVTAWLRSPESPNGKSVGIYCIPRVCEVKGGHIYFRPHPNITEKFTEKISSPAEATDSEYSFKTELAEGEKIIAGGYMIGRAGNRIYTDKSRVIRNHTECRVLFETPELSGKCTIEVFVAPNIIEVYVNGGEFVITNAVYDLSDEFVSEKEISLFTVK